MPLTGDSGVAIIDATALTVIGRVATGPHPQDAVASPDGRTVYVLEMGSDEVPGHTIAVLDLHTLQVARRLDVLPYHRPHWAQISRDGTTLWVACAPDQSVLEIDLATGRVVQAWRTPQPGPWNFAVAADGSRIVTADFDGASATVFERRTRSMRVVRLSGKPLGIAASPDGHEFWLSTAGSDSIYVLSHSADTILARFASNGAEPARIAFTPDGRRVVVANSRSNTVSIYDARSRQVLVTIPTDGAWPKGLLLDAAGRRAFVSLMGDRRLLVIDVESGRVVGRIEVGNGPERMALGEGG